MFEYVTRQESLPIRKKVEELLSKIHKELRAKGIRFNHRLVGSASRNLITRIKNGNAGYDFDFDLELTQIPEEFWDAPKKIKQLFIDAFNNCGLNFNNAEDSTSVFTVKKIDKQKSKILYSFDFAISRYVIEKGKQAKEYVYYNKKSKSNNDYVWQLKQSKINYGNIEQKIKKAKQWQLVREKYLINKNKEPNKKSRIVFYETLKWVYENVI